MKYKKENLAIVMLIAILFLPNLLFGATLDVGNTTAALEGVRKGFVAVAIVSAVILVIYTGFKLYMGQTLQELSKLLWMIAAFASAAAIGEFVKDILPN